MLMILMDTSQKLIQFENLLTDVSHLTLIGIVVWFAAWYQVEKMITKDKIKLRKFISNYSGQIFVTFILGLYWVTVDDGWLPILFGSEVETMEEWAYLLPGPAVHILINVAYRFIKKYSVKPEKPSPPKIT